MIKKIKNILKTLKIPVEYIIRPKFGTSKVVITYHFYNLSHAYYGDGEGKNFQEALQIDVFYKSDIGDLDRKIIKLMKDNNIRFNNIDDYVEDIAGIRLYHKILRFNYVESEVMINE